MSSRDHQTADRLHSAAIHVLRRVRREDETFGVSPARLSALSVLAFGGPRTLGELATAEQVTAPTMSAIVSGLERDGLARRRPQPGDARAVRVEPTAKGTRLLQRARKRRIANLVELLDPLDADERETVREAAEILERAVRR
jgi:DNA-binding MarR family transcriptional regulator